MTSEPPSPGIDVSKAHPARRYNYWLDGKDNFPADRESADAIEQVFPHIRTAAVENRRFLQRAVRFFVDDAGISQFLDVGTGLPTADNTHEVAQGLRPTSRVVYVDNDPLVLTHARALLTSHPDGATAYLDADLRRPADILNSAELQQTIDLSQPVGVLLIAILHFVDDHDTAYDAVRTLVDALAPGSYLAISHATADLLPRATVEGLSTRPNIPGRADFTGRTRAQVERFFDGLTLIEPGIEVVSKWRREPGSTPPPDEHVSVWGGVARKD